MASDEWVEQWVGLRAWQGRKGIRSVSLAGLLQVFCRFSFARHGATDRTSKGKRDRVKVALWAGQQCGPSSGAREGCWALSCWSDAVAMQFHFRREAWRGAPRPPEKVK